MKVLDNYQCEGQMSMFDIYGQDFLFGKTFPEPLVQTKEKTLDAYSKKFAELRIKMPQYLCLKKVNGQRVDASWEIGGALLGEYMTRSFGEYPNEERESRLSQILEAYPHPKYCLSAKACQGILRRAESRGKELPPLLKETLMRQSLSKNEQDVTGGAKESSYNATESEPCQHLTTNQYCKVYGISPYDSNAMKSANPHSGIYEANTSRTLDLNGGSPACNQGGMVVLEGNGSRPSHQGDGYRESEVSYTLNSTEQHAVCYESIEGGGAEPTVASKASFFLKGRSDGTADTLVATDYKDPQIVCYGIDRAAFNQGKNAQFGFSVNEELAQPGLAKGWGGVLTKQWEPYVQEITKE